ncbi:MAG: polysaccharide deacetylase family protein [Opitutus sp.]
MTEGLPVLLDLLLRLGIRGTFFTTGEMARRFPDVIRRLVHEGHELGCHGDLHQDFTTLDFAQTDTELRDSLATLRAYSSVESFRAPYLRFPSKHLPLLVRHGLTIDSSVARYKAGPNHRPSVTVPGLTRVAASVTSSVLRLPTMIRAPWLRGLSEPLMLFVHPWEAVDFRRSALRWDCRFRTGAAALSRWDSLLTSLRTQGARFVPIKELVELSFSKDRSTADAVR